ncbi:terminase large subunit domain-containing protein [Lacipirellula parvula]|uniref:Terminase large subunit-like ATPase domain-containing protein n=1 Tax=Lacipirellula parvula TaxID=2650471 RepID=A0A5K7X904_9BACT|nr:terminase large subunit [Lacipirellula parvula]BBO32382.1 hypothetical protein PLANPX_1994 [Lacipirellula parvula]
MNAAKLAKYAENPAAFRDDLLVDADGSVKRFGQIMDDWQREDFAAIDPGLMRCAGRSDSDTAVMRAYLERPRGHSKTTDLAVIVIWALMFATRPIKGYCFAADSEQAALLRNAIDVILRLNPWLAEVIEVQKLSVVNVHQTHPGFGASLTVSTSDVASSYGILPDLIIADELTHWLDSAEQLFGSLISSAAKRTGCLFVIISNAGFAETWQWKLRESIRNDEDWIFRRLDGPVASWMTEKTLAEQRRLLPGLAYNRLWLNEWSSAGGDALTKEDIAAAFKDDLQPMRGDERDYIFVAGLDLGLTRDCSAVVVLAVPEGGVAGKIRLAHQKQWRPTLGQKIDLIEVEQYILSLEKQYGLEFIGFDPWQAEHLAQTLEADSGHRRRNSRRLYGNQPWMREIPPVAANLRQQATLTIECFGDRRIQLYDCEPLRRDLNRLRVEEKSYGCRLTSPRDGDGHGDTFSAFALALLMAHEVAGVRPFQIRVLYNPTDNSPPPDPWSDFDRRRAEYEAEESRVRAMPNNRSFNDALNNGFVDLGGNLFG